MRLYKYLNELASEYGKGISFFDVDDSIFHTFSKILVMKNNKSVKELDNQEFNTYELQDGESFDFKQFGDAKFFRETSIPIPQTINRIKRIFQNIEIRGSKVVLLTARSDFDDKHEFLNTFKDYGIPIDDIYIERAGNIKTGTVASKKEKIIMKYISTGQYRRVRLIDDSIENIKTFLEIKNKIPKNIINKVKENYNIKDNENFSVISFYGLLVLPNGNLKRIGGY